MDFTVRVATKADLEGIWSVHQVTYLATYARPYDNISQEAVIQFLKTQGRANFGVRMMGLGGKGWDYLYLVGLVDEKIVAYGVAGTRTLNREIRAIYVLPDYQNQGIGTEMVKQMLAWLGQGEVKLTVANYALKAIAFYKARGFELGQLVDDYRRLATIEGVRINEVWMVRS